jgi:hypothetical protein
VVIFRRTGPAGRRWDEVLSFQRVRGSLRFKAKLVYRELLAKKRRFLRNESFMPVASAPQDERDVSRSDWKTASFGRGSQRGCPVSADLSVQMGAGVGWLTELCTDFSDCLLSFFPLPSDSCADVI